MASANITKLAKMLIAAAKGQSAATRSPQLPSSSVTTPSGESIDLGAAVEAAVDANAGVEFLDTTVSDIGDYAGTAVDDISRTPERVWENVPAFEIGVTAAQRANDAIAAAEQAAIDASASLVGMNGKNARRAGKTEADLVPPETGWVDGDEWIVLNDAGVPVELRMRVGTTWVPYNLIANSVLVLSENGTVQIRDGLITAPKLAVDALDFKTAQGMQVIGGKLIGGEISLGDDNEKSVVWRDDCESLDSWGGRELALSTIRVNGAYSIRAKVGPGFGSGVYCAPDSATLGTGNTITAWVRSSVKQNISVNGWPRASVNDLGEIEANEWTKFTIEVTPYLPYSIGFEGSVEGSTLWIDDLEFSSSAASQTSGIHLFRDDKGVATLETSAGVTSTSMRGGVIVSTNHDVVGASSTLDTVGLHIKTPYSGAESRLTASALTFENIDNGTGRSASISHSVGTEGKPNELNIIAEKVGFGGPVEFTDGITPKWILNWDHATKTGFYTATNAHNGPTTGWYAGIVTENEENGRILQEVREAKASTHHIVYRRYWHGTAWTPWVTDDDRDLWVKQTVKGLTWPGSGNGWYWTAAVRVTFPSGKFSKVPYMGGVHVMADGFMIFAMLMKVTKTYFEIRLLKYNATALTSASLEYTAHER